MTIKNIKILLLMLTLLATGCHTAKKAARVPEVVPPAEEEAVVEPVKRNYTVMSFEGTVEGISVSGQLRLAQDSVMWLSVNKIIEMGRAMCTPDSLWLRTPLFGHDDAMNYADLQRLTGVAVTFDEMQQTALAPDAEERIADLARQLGIAASVRITQRRQVEHLTFPYTKPLKP